MTPTYELREGQEFRVVQAFEDSAEQVFWLRTDLDCGGAWFLERGIIGDFKGKKLARRIFGSLERKKAAVMQISEVEGRESRVEEPEVRDLHSFYWISIDFQ